MSRPPAPSAQELVVSTAEGLLHSLLDEIGPELAAASGHAIAEPKDDGTPVTSWDLAANDYLSAAIRDAFPEHAILSEEAETAWNGARWTWVIDPIDGTSNFIAGIPYWAVSVALALEGRPVLACVDAPALGDRYVAIAGSGARLRRRTGAESPITVMPALDFRSGIDAHTPLAVSAGLLRRARSTAIRLNPRIMGAWALDLALVAAGRFIGAVASRPKVWDVAAGALLVEEAGGAIHMRGAPLLPLRPNIDYDDESTLTVAGPTPEWVADLTGELP